LGGLARRAGYAAKVREDKGIPTLHVDAGGFFKPLGPDSEGINRLMEESLDLLPVRVLNLTADDLHVWNRLSSTNHAQTQVISSNLVAGAGQTQPQRTAVVEVDLGGSKARIGFIGLCDPALVKPNSGFQARDLEESAAEAIASLAGKADWIVLLADIPRESAERLAAVHSEIYAVLLVERQYRMVPPAQFGNAVVLVSVERGRYLGELVVGLDEAHKVAYYKPDYVELSQDIPDDPVLAEKAASISRTVSDGDH